MKQSQIRVWLAAALTMLAVGCGGGAQVTAPITNIDSRLAVTGEGDFEEVMAEAEAHWANRTDQAELEAAIAAWERAITLETPGDRRTDLYPVLVSLSRANYFLADGHIRFASGADTEDRMKATFYQGVEWGRLAMAVNNQEWNRALLYETPIAEAVQLTTPSDMPAMYWYSTNMGKWALLDGVATILAYKDDIAAIMTRLAEMDRSFFYGASDRYFGAYWTKLPMGNPDLERARGHFEAAIAQEPNYFSTRVLFAEEYATRTQNRELFVEQLEYVLNTDPATLPDVAPENMAEQRKAQLLMDEIDEYFR
ncbi:MAG: hypothetical protein KC561_01725 [Myxococcales bacterium]|nr:hypothetical protein [Myxococcales bacterium]